MLINGPLIFLRLLLPEKRIFAARIKKNQFKLKIINECPSRIQFKLILRWMWRHWFVKFPGLLNYLNIKKKRISSIFYKKFSHILNQYQNLVKITSYHLKFTLLLLYYHSIKNKLIFNIIRVKIWFCSWIVKDDFFI